MTDRTEDEIEARRGESAVVVSIILGVLALAAWPAGGPFTFLLGVAGLILSFYGLRLTKGRRYPVARWVALALPAAALLGIIIQSIVRSAS